jgi:hypothetical protein
MLTSTTSLPDLSTTFICCFSYGCRFHSVGYVHCGYSIADSVESPSSGPALSSDQFLHQNKRLRSTFEKLPIPAVSSVPFDLEGTRKPHSRSKRPRLGMFHAQLWALATQWPDICARSYIPRLRLAGRNWSIGYSERSATSVYLEKASAQNSKLPNQNLTRRRRKQPVNCALVNTDLTSDFGLSSQRAVVRFREC